MSSKVKIDSLVIVNGKRKSHGASGPLFATTTRIDGHEGRGWSRLGETWAGNKLCEGGVIKHVWWERGWHGIYATYMKLCDMFVGNVGVA